MSGKDIFTAMIEEELNQYQRFFLFQERELFRQGKYEKLATQSLRQTRFFAVIVFLSIVIFSLLSIYHFVEFGTDGRIANIVLGILSWLFVIGSTIFYTRDVLEKKRCMERVLKLIKAREEYSTKNKEV